MTLNNDFRFINDVSPIKDLSENNMPQNVQKCPTDFSDDRHLNSSKANPHLNSVMSDLNRLSKSFVNSYQNLEGQVEQLNGELQNVTEQKSDAIVAKQKLISEKQAINDRLQNLLAILPSGVVVLDGKGIVRDCNAVAIDILGRPLLGESWLNVINRAFLPQADDGHQISLKDGRKVHIETRALDSEPGQMIVLTDMTKTRQLQAELSQQQKLSSMGKMIASLAHQIRTPLAAAILYGSHLNSEKLEDEKKKSFSLNLMERLRFMDRQISDMLNFVKGERKQKIPFKAQFLIDSIKSSYDDFDHPIIYNIENNQVTNEISEQSLIVGDPDALMGAINNLVNNAIDASESHQQVVISFSYKNKKRFVIEVKDQGCGIDSKDKKNLFEPFYSTKNHGNGLGLSIVHGVVIEHKGSIEVDSIKGEGSRFVIDLPLTCNELIDRESMVSESKTSTSTSPLLAISNLGNSKFAIPKFKQEIVYDD